MLGSWSTTGGEANAPAVPELRVQPPSSLSFLDEPLHLGVCRCRDSGSQCLEDSTALMPQHTKHLRTYAKKACEEQNIPSGPLEEFVNVLSVSI